MSALAALLNTYRNASLTEREKGTYFEELICAYLRNEATYRDPSASTELRDYAPDPERSLQQRAHVWM